MPGAVSKRTAKLLKEITGEPRVDAAVLMTLRDALSHRLEAIEAEIEEFEDEHGMSFEAFEEAWEDGEIEDRQSYDVEKTYWRWEELVTRREKIEETIGMVP